MGEGYSGLGRIAMAQEKYDEAASLFRKAMETKQRGAGDDSPELIADVWQLARALWREGDKSGAQTAMARCVSLQKLAFANPAFEGTTIGPGAPNEDVELQPLGQDEWLLYQGEFEAAANGFRAKIGFEETAKEIVIDPEGMPHWEKLAEAEEGLGHMEAARDAYLRAAAQWDERLSAGHPRAEWCRARAESLRPASQPAS